MINKNYKTVIYAVEIELTKSPNEVFSHLIDLKKWWPEDFEGEDIKLNSEFVFTTGVSHYSKNKVIELVPDKKFVWLVTEGIRKTDNFEWTGTKMSFELMPNGENTTLKFIYDGVVLENESERLVQICDMTVKEFFYNFVNTGIGKDPLINMRKDFHKTIKVNTSAEEAINKISQVNLWWATNVQGSTKNLNDVFTVRFGKTFSTIHITEMIPENKILWSILNSSLPLFKDENVWNGTKLLWEIFNANNATEIRMTHIGLTPDKECYEDCNKGWSFYVGESLRKLITEGKGLPGTGIFANISNDNRRYEGLLYFKNDPLPDYSENFFFVDVKETTGETVTQIYSAAKYNKEIFSSQLLEGDYFMIIKNTALYNNLSPLEDISATINRNN